MDGDRLIGTDVAGFRVDGVLGEGAFATVYRARQDALDRDVALKILDPLLARNPDAARRFDGEGQRAAALDHPAIVAVYAAGEDEHGLHYLAMQLIDGHSLADELAPGRVDDARTLAVLEPVASALDHAHAAGVIHRDVKPGNILIAGDRVWLADFGIAASAQSVGQYTTGALGTVEYMAPEQARAGEIDGRADLYALGCVAFECLTGRPPYLGDDLVEILLAHQQDPIPGTGNLALDAFMLRALARIPPGRFASGADFMAALAAALGGTVDAPPRVENRRRVRLPILVGIVIVAAVVAIGFVATRHGSSSRALRSGLSGPVTVRDPNGARYRLPNQWSIGGINPDASAYETELKRASARVGTITAMPATGATAADLAAQSRAWPCPPTSGAQTPVLVGATAGVFCDFPDAHTYVFYVVAAGHDWTIALDNGVAPVAEISQLRASFTFG